MKSYKFFNWYLIDFLVVFRLVFLTAIVVNVMLYRTHLVSIHHCSDEEKSLWGNRFDVGDFFSKEAGCMGRLKVVASFCGGVQHHFSPSIYYYIIHIKIIFALAAAHLKIYFWWLSFLFFIAKSPFRLVQYNIFLGGTNKVHLQPDVQTSPNMCKLHVQNEYFCILPLRWNASFFSKEWNKGEKMV